MIDRSVVMAKMGLGVWMDLHCAIAWLDENRFFIGWIRWAFSAAAAFSWSTVGRCHPNHSSILPSPPPPPSSLSLLLLLPLHSATDWTGGNRLPYIGPAVRPLLLSSLCSRCLTQGPGDSLGCYPPLHGLGGSQATEGSSGNMAADWQAHVVSQIGFCEGCRRNFPRIS